MVHVDARGPASPAHEEPRARALETRVRSPTGLAWTLWAASAVATGEVAYEMQKPEMATLFGVPFADDELWGIVALGGALLALATLWLLSLYFAPGRLRLDLEGGLLRREERPAGRLRVREGPLERWRVRLVYFNEADHIDGRFKRLELSGPDSGSPGEALLFNDVRGGGEELALALEQTAGSFENFEVVLEKKPSASR